MNNRKYDMAVCWRTYPGVSKTPAFFADNKYKLAQLSFQSFLKCVEGLRVKWFIILDGCPREFEDIFAKHVSPGDLEIIHTDKIGNQATFNKQIEILLEQTAAELVYFAEDDYLYRPCVFGKMIDFMNDRRQQVDFITPYDHLDHYEHPIHAKKHDETMIGDVKWKTIVSTCLTFLTTKRVLKETRGVFDTYCRGNTDVALWVALTRSYGIASLIRFGFTNKECFFIVKKSMKYSPGQFLTGKKYFIWCPVPSFATHLEKRHLAPGVDWTAVKDQVMNETSFI